MATDLAMTDLAIGEELRAEFSRRAMLQQTQDIRDLLGNDAQTIGVRWQNYRDCWAALCRRLCDERGKPVLTVHGGGHRASGAPEAA